MEIKIGEIDFWAPDGGGYVHVQTNKRPGCLGYQICKGGDFTGSTLTTKPGVENLEKVARSWLKQRGVK